jgi:hypothetical protein
MPGLYTLKHQDVQRIVFKFSKKPKLEVVHHVVATKGVFMYNFLFENNKCTSYPPTLPHLRGESKSKVTSQFKKDGYTISVASFQS